MGPRKPIRWGLTADEMEIAGPRAMFETCDSAPETAVTVAPSNALAAGECGKGGEEGVAPMAYRIVCAEQKAPT